MDSSIEITDVDTIKQCLFKPKASSLRSQVAFAGDPELQELSHIPNIVPQYQENITVLTQYQSTIIPQ